MTPDAWNLSPDIARVYGSDVLSMKQRDKLIRHKEWKLRELSRKIAQVEATIAELEHVGSSLSREIKIEEDHSKISNPDDIAYPTYAKATRQRLHNLNQSIARFRVQLDGLKAAQLEAIEMFASLERLDADKLRKNASVSFRQVDTSAVF